MIQTARILNLNIWNYNDPWPVRLDLISSLILDADPDIVALQEVRYQDWIDPHHQADQILARLSGYSAVWNPAAYWSSEQSGDRRQLWEGLAILSRHPIVDRRMARLERDMTDPHNHFDRLVLGAQIRFPASPLWLFDTHFPLSARARERVAPTALDFVTQTAASLPFAFTGDFNALPTELSIRYLTGQAQIDGQCGNLGDAWTMCHPDENGYTFPAWDPEKRIDYVFHSANVQVQSITIVGSTLSREHASPSDHCGLLATLAI